jgi:hypothetical protein
MVRISASGTILSFIGARTRKTATLNKTRVFRTDEPPLENPDRIDPDFTALKFLLRRRLLRAYASGNNLRPGVVLAFHWTARQPTHHGDLAYMRE